MDFMALMNVEKDDRYKRAQKFCYAIFFGRSYYFDKSLFNKLLFNIYYYYYLYYFFILSMRALILDHSDNSTVMRKRNIRMLSRFAVGIAKCQMLKSPPSARCCRVRRLLATDCTKEQLVRPLPSEMTSSSFSAWQHPRTSTFARCS